MSPEDLKKIIPLELLDKIETYDDYKRFLREKNMQLMNEILVPKNAAEFIERSDNNAIAMFVYIYCGSQFYPHDVVIDIFESLGFEEKYYKKYMLSIDEFELLIKEPQLKGIEFEPMQLLSAISSQLLANFLANLFPEHSLNELKYFNKPKLWASPFYINIYNFFRRLEDRSRTRPPKLNTELEKGIFYATSNFSLGKNKENMSADFKQFFQNIAAKERNRNLLLKNVFRTILKTNIKSNIKGQHIKYAFRGLFYRIFEDDFTIGLCTESEFKKLDDQTQASYQYQYNRYYQKKLITLIGI